MSLPPCSARRYFEPASAEYFCAHPDLHSQDQLVTAAICQACTLWQQPPPSTMRTFSEQSARRRIGLCIYLGDQLGLRDCPTCQGSVRVKVFACGHPGHVETTLAECGACADFAARPQSKET